MMNRVVSHMQKFIDTHQKKSTMLSKGSKIRICIAYGIAFIDLILSCLLMYYLLKTRDQEVSTDYNSAGMELKPKTSSFSIDAMSHLLGFGSLVPHENFSEDGIKVLNAECVAKYLQIRFATRMGFSLGLFLMSCLLLFGLLTKNSTCCLVWDNIIIVGTFFYGLAIFVIVCYSDNLRNVPSTVLLGNCIYMFYRAATILLTWRLELIVGGKWGKA